MKTRIRKKGGGRKPFDNKYSERQFVRRLNKYFEYNYSVKEFIEIYGISRQSFYRFLNNNPKVKESVSERIELNKKREVRERTEYLKWLLDNPNRSWIDWRLENSLMQSK